MTNLHASRQPGGEPATRTAAPRPARSYADAAGSKSQPSTKHQAPIAPTTIAPAARPEPETVPTVQEAIPDAPKVDVEEILNKLYESPLNTSVPFHFDTSAELVGYHGSRGDPVEASLSWLEKDFGKLVRKQKPPIIASIGLSAAFTCQVSNLYLQDVSLLSNLLSGRARRQSRWVPNDALSRHLLTFLLQSFRLPQSTQIIRVHLHGTSPSSPSTQMISCVS